MKIKSILEAVFMAANEPLNLARLEEILAPTECSRSEIIAGLQDLAADYAESAVELKEVAGGYRFQVRTEYAPWVARLWSEKTPQYSRATLETLAIIAYRQPITRPEIEDIRGVAVSSHIIRNLLDRGWIRINGHREVPGRPALFGTTKDFLDYFNLKSLDQLPVPTEAVTTEHTLSKLENHQ